MVEIDSVACRGPRIRLKVDEAKIRQPSTLLYRSYHSWATLSLSTMATTATTAVRLSPLHPSPFTLYPLPFTLLHPFTPSPFSPPSPPLPHPSPITSHQLPTTPLLCMPNGTSTTSQPIFQSPLMLTGYRLQASLSPNGSFNKTHTEPSGQTQPVTAGRYPQPSLTDLLLHWVRKKVFWGRAPFPAFAVMKSRDPVSMVIPSARTASY